MRKPIAPKELPSFRSDAEAEAFIEQADFSRYDLSGGEFVRFELKPKDKTVNLRLPGALLDAVRVRAKRAGVPF